MIRETREQKNTAPEIEIDFRAFRVVLWKTKFKRMDGTVDGLLGVNVRI